MAALPLPDLYEKVARVVPPVEWPALALQIERILELKRQKKAVILAHTYQAPEIYFTVADFVGDSLQLARMATQVEADIIVQAGVKFMADTSKILNPHRKVLIPDLRAGCSLAESITGEDVRKLKEKHPGLPVVTYVNTNADVKAESDICCTSSNAVEVVESLGVDKVLFIPDRYLAKWVAKNTTVEIISWDGACEVHERFTRQDILALRTQYPGLHVLAHPECPPDVLEEADYVGSTSAMVRHIGESGKQRIALITECSMSTNVTQMYEDVDFVRPCNLCPHMRRITLPKLIESLEKEQHEIVIREDIRIRAKAAIDAMLAVRLNKAN